MKNMMKEMMREMMMEMMQETMREVMSEMTTPSVAKAEAVETPTEKKTGVKKLPREEFLALSKSPSKPKAEVDYPGLDIVAYGNKMVKYNQRVNSNIWQYTDMVVRNKYNGRCSKYRGEFVWSFDNPADRQSFLSSFQIMTEFDAEELKIIKEYKHNKEVARAKRVLENANK